MKRCDAARAAAKAAGSVHYTTGISCPNGHNGPRYTSNGSCVACLKGAVKDRLESGYFREYYADNAERISDRGREYSERNREAVNARAAAWSARNPDKRRAISRQYKAKRRAQEEAGITGGVLAAWAAAQPKVCFYCSVDCGGGFHVDHFVPLARGGAHVLTNLRIACPPCNLRKNAADPLEWMEAA